MVSGQTDQATQYQRQLLGLVVGALSRPDRAIPQQETARAVAKGPCELASLGLLLGFMRQALFSIIF